MGKKIITVITLAGAAILSLTMLKPRRVETISEDTGIAKLGKYSVELGESEYKQEETLGKTVNVIYIKILFTNNSDKPKKFCAVIKDTAEQDGCALKDFNSNEFMPEDAGQYKSVPPGEQKEVTLAYELIGTTDDVQLKLEKTFGGDSYTYLLEL